MPIKPTSKEDEYFARMEFERLRKIEEEKQAHMKSIEKQRLKELHHMKCPKCGMQLIEIEYRGLRIDECSECRGVWFDAGELQQISKFEAGALTRMFSIFK